MHVKLQLVMCSDDGCEETVMDVVTLQKNHHRIEHLGLTLAGAKHLLSTIQQCVLTQQVDAFLASHGACDACGTILKVKGSHTRTLRTLLGTFTLPSPRFYRCRCQHHKATMFRPLTALLPASVTPELLFMEAKWASLVSYGLTVDALTDFLPLDVTLDVKTVRHDTLKVAQRCKTSWARSRGAVWTDVSAMGTASRSPMAPSSWALMAGMCGIGRRRSGTSQIPPDLVVKSQAADIIDIIL
jgi:hypothetical protein